MMEEEYDFSKGERGPVTRVSKGKTHITIRIDDDVLAWFRDQVECAGGGSCQAMMNVALREFTEGVSMPRATECLLDGELITIKERLSYVAEPFAGSARVLSSDVDTAKSVYELIRQGPERHTSNTSRGIRSVL